VLPALDAVRALPGGYADQLAGGGWFSGWGLSQADKLGETAVTSYRRLLNQLFLPRVMLRLEGQLQRGGSSPDYVYEALKAYLMLDSKDHYDADGIRAFVELDWDTNLQRTVSTEQRAALGAHLAATFEQRPIPLPLPLNEAVIVQARREVRSLPLDERIYGRLKRTFSADIRGFNIRDAAGGPTADLVFVRKSGVPLDTPVAPLFTKEAYQNVFAERSEALVRELASESWILGEEQAIAANEEARLLGLVRDRYLAEFTRLYTDTILDVGLVAFATPEEAARVFNLLSRPADSPLVLLLQEIERQTSLDQRDGAAAPASGGGVAEFRNRLQDVIGGADRGTGPTAAAAANPVTERFRPLADLVTAREGQPRPVDHLLGLLRDLYEYLTVVSSEAAGGSVPPNVQQQGQAVLQQLRVAAATQPDLLVGDLLESTTAHTTALTTGGLLTYLNEQWRSGPLAVCRQAIAGRYPIVTTAQQEIRIADFGEFFGYGGHLERFFNEHLRQYVDSSESPWKPRVTANLPVQLSPAALRAFENADVVRRTFFRQGSMAPEVSFDLKPLEMDTSLSRFLLDLEGQVVTYEFGPMDTKLMKWPGPNPGNEVRMEMRDRQSGATTMARRTGPWAWFRLLQGNLAPTDVPEEFEVTFAQENRSAVYQLTARSAFNPFALPQLQRFECPNSL
jgi:type VI secretion system protein ImpL